tara:strand:- start:3549 stop:3923 length:375 start_codon:yes stop_codon:yes gene_type:complete
MNNSILGYSFSSNYSNINGKINTSHELTKIENGNIVTKKYRNNKLVQILKSPRRDSSDNKKQLVKKGIEKLKDINLGKTVKSRKKSTRKIKNSVKKIAKKLRSPKRKRSVKSKRVLNKFKRKNN